MRACCRCGSACRSMAAWTPQHGCMDADGVKGEAVQGAAGLGSGRGLFRLARGRAHGTLFSCGRSSSEFSITQEGRLPGRSVWSVGGAGRRNLRGGGWWERGRGRGSEHAWHASSGGCAPRTIAAPMSQCIFHTCVQLRRLRGTDQTCRTLLTRTHGRGALPPGTCVWCRSRLEMAL